MTARLVGLLSLFCLCALASSRPSWLTHSKVEDTEFRYYIGRASAAASEARAWEIATHDAYQTAIRENFGFETRVQSENFQTSDLTTQQNETTTRVVESSGKVEIHEFEQADSYEETTDAGKIDLWVLFRYRKSAIDKEKQRLAAQPKSEPEPAFSEQGTESDAERGTVEIVTHPSGAVVFVDGERYGKTPLRLRGQLALGKHTVQVDQPSYAVDEKSFLVASHTTERVEMTLKPAEAYLQVTSEPPNASLIVDGKAAGNTPTPLLTVPAGKKLLIEATREGASRVTEEITVDRGLTRNLKLVLSTKPAFLSVISDPPGASVVLAAEKPVKLTSAPTGLMKLEPRAYTVTVSRAGFQPYETRVVLHGGEKVILPVVRLVPSARVTSTADTSPSIAASAPDSRREVAERWRQYVYRGFPDTSDTKACYYRKKGLVQELVAEQSSSQYLGLKAIAEGRSDDPNFGAGAALVDRLQSVDTECRKALLTSPPWDGS